MASFRPDRVSEFIRQELSRILREEVKNPNIPAERLSILSVETSRDLSHAKVMVSVYGSEQEGKDAVKALKSAEGFLRRELGKVMTTRITPELTFALDTSLEYAQHMQKLFDAVHQQENHES